MNIIITHNKCCNSFEIEIKFENIDTLIKFSNLIFKQYGIDIHINTYNDTFNVELKDLKPTHSAQHTNKNILDNLSFPPNVENIVIVVNLNVFNHNYISTIELCNLPENLTQLKIYSHSILFNLSNLPTNIFLLDISECIPKLNLDYLPGGLKILYLPVFPCMKKHNFTYSYNLTNLINLPSSLIEINFGYVVFKSLKDLINSFDKTINEYNV